MSEALSIEAIDRFLFACALSHHFSLIEQEAVDQRLAYLEGLAGCGGERVEWERWEFRKDDPEPFPSVPHGHDRSDGRIRLDPYLGVVYCGETAVGRVSGEQVRALWNDAGFCQNAHEAISFYLLNCYKRR